MFKGIGWFSKDDLVEECGTCSPADLKTLLRVLDLNRYVHLRSFHSPSFRIGESKEGLGDLFSKPPMRDSVRTLILMLLQDQLPSIEELVGLKSRMLKGITFPFLEDRMSFQAKTILSEMDMAN